MRNQAEPGESAMVTVDQQSLSNWLRWNAIASLSSGFLLVTGLILGAILRTRPNTASALAAHLGPFNDGTYAMFIVILLGSAGALLTSCWANWTPKPNLDCVLAAQRALKWARQHPISAALLVGYAAAMVAHSSWMHKEIVTWYDDIHADQLLNNFSLRWSFIGEVRGRNDFRFFPLSHQDLHILSWFTPFPKVWGLVSALELVVTLLAGVKIVKRLRHWRTTTGITLIATLIYLFTTSAAYNYFQFIYSERILTLCLALFALSYLHYQQTRADRLALAALFFALIGCFVKDTGILLFAIPALATVLLGSLGFQQNYPSWKSTPGATWLHAYRLELSLLSLCLFFLAAFTWMSYVPSILAGEQRYDASLRFAMFEPDLRMVIVLLFTMIRTNQILKRRNQSNLLDSLNLGAITYSMALFSLVGFKSSSYMTLPIQWVATLDILFIWCSTIAPRLLHRWKPQTITALGAGLGAGLITLDHINPENFYNKTRDIQITQNAWQATLQQTIQVARETKEKNQAVNLIFSKSWFKHSDYLRSLPFDRLIYNDPDTHDYRIIEGINKGQLYTPQKGDLFLNIDSGNKLKKYNIDLSTYKVIYEYDPSISYGKIYRHL